MIPTSLSRQIGFLTLILVTAFLVILWSSILSIRAAMDRQASADSHDLMRGRVEALQEQVSLIASDYHNWTDVFYAAVDQDFEELYTNYGITAVRGDIFQYAQMFDGPFAAPAAWEVGSPREPQHSFLPEHVMGILQQEVPKLDFNERETFDYFGFHDGEVVMFSASWLLPEDALVIPEVIDGDLAIAVIGKVLSDAQLARTQTDLNVSALQIHENAEAGRAVTLPLEGPGGRPVAHLSWQPPTPGSELVDRIRPIMIGVTIAFALLALAAARLLHGKAKELMQKQAEAAALARIDPLTGLPNRLALREHLDAAGGPGARFAVLSLDIDRFKQINDIIGHAGGDIFLQRFADRVRRLTDEDTFACRQGGDEFVLVMRGGDDLDRRIANKCRDVESAFRDTVSVGGYAFDMHASKGVAVSEPGGRDVEKVLLKADRAMYHAKRRRRQDVVPYDLGMEASDALDSSIEKALRYALEEMSEFFVEYQPIVNARFPGGIDKFEALARWESARLGRVSPADFIPVAEATGLIAPLSKLLLDIICRDLEVNPGPMVSVNVSPLQLMSTGFAGEFSSQVERAGIEPRRIEIEITETIALSDDRTVASTLHELRSRGFSIALDDFGTGFSSVGYLAAMPFNVLKIDRSFISGKAAGDRSMTIIKSMVSLAHSLDMIVVAEGVEAERDAVALRDFGCDKFQGFHYGRPAPLRTFFDAAQLQLDLEAA